MITCPNCAHPNPEGATQCEACYTPLPETVACPNCKAAVSAGAEYCGQCGYAMQSVKSVHSPVPQTIVNPPTPASNLQAEVQSSPIGPAITPPPLIAVMPDATVAPTPLPPSPTAAKTQLQQFTARLLHVQSNTVLELPPHLDVIHIGKPNDRVPPDLDVSGFADSDIVSRIHADIRAEAGAYYIEDIGSSNGTYVNNLPLRPGDRHRLRPGDRISLGKGDKVTFHFQA
ncbi:FHA domain-containing protein [Trichocoleus sp. FACHB-262]|uniref:FHA domain-containing protein n=1 Tax=Trichocoleus sp. FACHB-262 TaxID=2692869 RepID=UPI0016875BF3|nr:FHA domain-containing protein [Trichocoleus sp. FACHB-262]MBD2119909.1 FHA domain-containing protein [Trichocoleus sp. FACHB-262]